MTYPTTKDGRELDSYLNDVDHQLSEIRNTLDIDADTIPSDAQREAFTYLQLLLGWAESFTGTLRYDVSVKHDDCPEHDDYARRKLAMAQQVLGKPLTDKENA